MFYYQFNIADYASATAHLSNLEDLAYRRLLDLYYDQEKPLPNDTKWIARRIRLSVADVENVLLEFFDLTDGGYIHHRCEFELAKYRKRAETNKINGLKGGRKPTNNPIGTQSEPNGLRTETQTEPKPNPRLSQPNNLITQEPKNQDLSYEISLPDGGKRSKKDLIPYDQIADSYNEICTPHGRPAARRMTDKRRARIKAIWQESEKARSLDWWRDYWQGCMQVKWLAEGFIGSDGKHWGPDIDYLLRDKILTGMIEGSL